MVQWVRKKSCDLICWPKPKNIIIIAQITTHALFCRENATYAHFDCKNHDITQFCRKK